MIHEKKWTPPVQKCTLYSHSITAIFCDPCFPARTQQDSHVQTSFHHRSQVLTMSLQMLQFHRALTEKVHEPPGLVNRKIHEPSLISTSPTLRAKVPLQGSNLTFSSFCPADRKADRAFCPAEKFSARTFCPTASLVKKIEKYRQNLTEISKFLDLKLG